jgi:hypothetical protein
MAFFKNIKKKVVNTAQGAVKATKELAETSLTLKSPMNSVDRKFGLI